MSLAATWLACGVLGCFDDGAGLARDTIGGEVVDPDRRDPTCQGPTKVVPAACGAATVAMIPSRGRDHIPDGTPITYVDSPPSSGDHRPASGKWGEYTFLPPQRWLHNLEHGGIGFLYDPCISGNLVSALREFARVLPDDDTGPFRWVMTPYPGLPSGVAVVAWEHSWMAECLDEGNSGSLEGFITERYRNGPEDVASDGSYSTDWIGR